MFRIVFRHDGIDVGGFDHPGPQHVAEHAAHLALKYRNADVARVIGPSGGEVWSEVKDNPEEDTSHDDEGTASG